MNVYFRLHFEFIKNDVTNTVNFVVELQVISSVTLAMIMTSFLCIQSVKEHGRLWNNCFRMIK